MFIVPQSVFADCQIGPGKKVNIQVEFRGDKQSGSNITVNNVTRYRNPAQCTNPVASSTYTMSCDYDTDAYAADSVFPALCQSGVERGKANSTCYQCGAGVIKCDGFDGALGQSNSMFNTRQRCSMDNNNPNWSGDVYCPPPLDKNTKTFQYNGRDYDYHGELIIACGSNNQACGASEQCTNIVYPDITNHGESEKQQCTTVTRTGSVADDTDINLSARGKPVDVTGSETKSLIDVGGPTDPNAPQLSTLFGIPNTNPTITGLYQIKLNDGKTPIPKDESSNWGVTQIQLSTNGDILAPKSGYDIGDGFNYTVLYASPTELTLKATKEDNAVYGYTLHFAELNVDPAILNAYVANEKDRNNTLVAIPCGIKLGTPLNSTFKVAVADTGTFIDPRVRKDWWHAPTNDSCANIGPGSVPLLTTQICTEKANPQVASQMKLPWLQDWIARKDGLPSFIKPLAYNTFDVGKINFSNQTAKLTELTQLGDQTESAVAKLKPKELRVPSHIGKLSFSANTRLCHLTSDNEFKFTLPERNVISSNYPGLNKVVENSDMLAAFLSTNELSKNDLNFNARYRDKILDVQNSLPCEVNNSGTLAQEQSVQTSGDQEYTMPDSKAPKYKLPSFFAKIAENIAGWFADNCVGKNCELETDTGAYIEFSTHASYIDTASKRIGKDGNTEKGFTNFLRPHEKKLSKTNQLTLNNVDQGVGSNKEKLNQEKVLVKDGAAIKEREQLMNCALLPKEKQQEKNMNCEFNDSPQPVNTSDWAITNAGFSPANFVPSGPFADILKQKAVKYGVPLCVMQGVSQIEGGSRYKELPLDQCVNTVNNCSAVGPMQFTIGPNPKSDCTKCAAGYCPTAWKNWGNNGNPCSYEDSLDAAARYLAAFGHFTNAPAKDQVKSVHDATTAYYGIDNDKTARANLKGCEYWEYVYKQCNSTYTCKAAKSAL